MPPPEPDGRPSGPPRGTEIVTTAVQAAGELAQIGATVGAQLLKRAARPDPRGPSAHITSASFPRAESPVYIAGERGNH